MFKGIIHDTVSLQLRLTIIIRYWCNTYKLYGKYLLTYFIVQSLISLISIPILILLCWWIWQFLDFWYEYFYSIILESMHGGLTFWVLIFSQSLFCFLIFKVHLVWMQNPKFQISFSSISVILFELLWLCLIPSVW